MVIKFIKSIWNALTGVKEDPVQSHPLDGPTRVPPKLDLEPVKEEPAVQAAPEPAVKAEEPAKKTPKQITAERRKADSGTKRKKKAV